MRQHAGKPAKVVVARGTAWNAGMCSQSPTDSSRRRCASAAGKVTAIEQWPHPDGGHSLAIRIAVEPYSAQVPRLRTIPDWTSLTPAAIVQAVQDAGVVGLGGAAFPTHVKLAPPKDTIVHTILVNGAECEPC